MAIIYDRNNNSFTHIGVPFNYTRGNPVPIDNSSVWTSKEEAEQYAASNPTAYVGQILTVVDKDSGDVSQWQIADVSGKLETLTSKQNAYTRLSKLKTYLYAAEYDDVDYNFAQQYFKNHCQTAGGCTVIRNGNFVGRSLDAVYNDLVDVVVTVSAGGTRRASIGVASQVPGLTTTAVKSTAYNEMFAVVPFFVVDGINDAGVVVAINTTYDAAGKTTGTHADDPNATTLCALQLPRYVLDNFTTAKDAANSIKNNVNVYCPHTEEISQEYHLMIADENETYAVEFENNTCIVTKLDKQPWLTNFTVSGCTFGDDNTIAYKDSGLRSLARGVERSNIIAANYASTGSMVGMFKLICQQLKFTNAYNTATSPKWLSEFTDATLTIDKVADDASAFDTVYSAACTKFTSRSRDPNSASYGTLQSTHCCVYDIELRKLTINVQEAGLGSSLIFGIKPRVSTYRSGNYADAWNISSTAVAVANATLSPSRIDGLFGWKASNNSSLTYTNGNWHLSTAAGDATLPGYSAQRELLFVDYPNAGDLTVLLRRESDQDDDRLVTVRMLDGLGGGSGTDYSAAIQDLYARLGSVYYKPCADATFEDQKLYYRKSDDGVTFRQAVAGTDYNVGDSIPSGTYYSKVTSDDLTTQVQQLLDGKANKATTLEGYGISDAKIEKVSDTVNKITLGSTTIEVGTKSYVDNLVASEKTDLTTKLDSKVTVYKTGEESLVITTGDTPNS